MREVDYDSLRINDKQRFKTDNICTAIGAIFALTMFIMACVMWNRENFDKNFSFFSHDNTLKICGEGKIIFYQTFSDLTKYQCLQKCPVLYDVYQGICVPMQERKRQQFFRNPDLAVGFFGDKFKWVLLYTFIISLAIGLIRLAYIYFLPRLSVKIDFYLCILSLLGVAISLLKLYDSFWRNITALKIIIIVVCFIIALFVLTMMCFYRKQIKVYEVFVDCAVHHLSNNMKTYIYIPVFLLLGIGLVALITWQHICFISRQNSNRNVYDYSNSGKLGYLNLIQFWWGFQFLRDAFNFCVSGNVIDSIWVQNNKKYCLMSFFRLLCKNWGSVVGGSFYNAFFQIPSIIYQIIRCKPKTFCGRAGIFCYKNCSCFSFCFDLIRTDAYSYINLSGMDYCHSSTQCRRLCDSSDLFIGIHSPIHNYRLICHIFCVSCIIIISSFILKNFMYYYGLWNYVLMIVTALITITWFISIVSDTAEAFLVSYLCQFENIQEYQKMKIIKQPYISDLEHLERRVYKDGNC